MEHERGETEPYQQEQPSEPLRCPRCNSMDTKFRYYNNNDLGQPRHFCKTCRRYWTVGGSLRNIPFGGSRRNGKETKESSSLYSNSVSPILSPATIFEEEWEHKTQCPTAFGAVVPQDLGSLSATVSHPTSYGLKDEISCLDAIQSLTQPHIVNEPFNTRNHVGDSSINRTILQECNFQSMALHQPSPQQFPSYGNNLVHPNWTMSPSPQDLNNNFSFSTAYANTWNNAYGDTNDQGIAKTSMPHFPDYGGTP